MPSTVNTNTSVAEMAAALAAQQEEMTKCKKKIGKSSSSTTKAFTKAIAEIEKELAPKTKAAPRAIAADAMAIVPYQPKPKAKPTRKKFKVRQGSAGLQELRKAQNQKNLLKLWKDAGTALLHGDVLIQNCKMYLKSCKNVGKLQEKHYRKVAKLMLHV